MPPQFTPLVLRPLAMEILHRLEAKQAAEQEAIEWQQDRNGSEHESGPEAGSLLTAL
jgi:hypothetical protein